MNYKRQGTEKKHCLNNKAEIYLILRIQSLVKINSETEFLYYFHTKIIVSQL